MNKSNQFYELVKNIRIEYFIYLGTSVTNIIYFILQKIFQELVY